MRRLLSVFMVLATVSSCASLKPYERQYVDDPEMQMSFDSGKSFSNYVHSIREGATPAGAPKSSGGCGCN
ncbi:DUF4266 domain-containing protein [Marinoscillum sp.]|uniref:DUF4266 domain-containing protein n=1 Tax=Marinoscillum sp. TaxID=2024838 RepID=UPI003BAC4F39